MSNPAKRLSRTTWLLLGLLLVAGAVALSPPVARLRRQHGDSGHHHGGSEAAVELVAAQLSKTPAAERVSLLVKHLDAESPGLRYAAVDALGEQTGSVAADAMEQRAFRDSSSPVRERALEALPDVDPARGGRLLLAGLRDEDAWIRRTAVMQLSLRAGKQPKVVDRRAVPRLVQALDDSDPAVRAMAVGTLRKLTGKPWHARQTAPEPEKQAVLRQWRRWWDGARAAWPAADAPPLPRHPTRADPAPDVRLTDIDGRPFRLADQRGRITLLNFWGTWCPPCRVEIPDLVKLDAAYRGRGLDMVGIALSERDGADGLRDWCRAHGITYRQALATDDVLEAFDDIHAVPVSILIDARGRIRYRWEGERDFATFRAAVERLLGETNVAGTAPGEPG